MTLAGKVFFSGMVIVSTGALMLVGCAMAEAETDGPAAYASGGVMAIGLAFLPVAALLDIWGTP
jgi:hypothetical protein